MEVTSSPDDEEAHLALVAQFEPFPFTQQARDAILARRAIMSDELIFDLLLEQAAVGPPHTLYPPSSPEALRTLLAAIARSPWDALKRRCLHLYLLAHVSPAAAHTHAAACALPPQFAHLARACFLLDAGGQDDLARAVVLLADARIVQDLSSKILHTLVLAPQPAAARLVRTYVRTAQPVLEAYEDIAVYLRALLEASLADAWAFQRTFSETTPLRNQLFRTILDGCLIPPKPAVLPHLLSLTLTSYEFSLLQSYALSPPDELTPPALSILQDLIAVRLLHSGKYSDAIRLSRAFDTLNAKARTGRTGTGTAALQKAAEERQQMMRDVLAVVPAVQRRELEAELSDERAEGVPTPMGASWESVGDDVLMSWETLGSSGSAKARERTTGSGRLEGSPAPKFAGRAQPNSPFGLFSSSAASTPLKRKASAHTPATNIFGTPMAVGDAAPAGVLPTIPTPGLVMSASTGTIPIPVLSGFRSPPRRISFGTPQMQTVRNGAGVGSTASAPRPGGGLNARNAFFEPEPSRGSGPSLFGVNGPAREGTTNVFGTPRMRGGDGGGQGRKISAGKRPGDDRFVDDDDEGEEKEGDNREGMMVDSDDPDGFVVRGRRGGAYRFRAQAAEADAAQGNTETGTETDAGVPPTPTPTNGVHAPDADAALFGRRKSRGTGAGRGVDVDAPPESGSGSGSGLGSARRRGSPHAFVVPGGYAFASLERHESDADVGGAAPPPAPLRGDRRRQPREPAPSARPSRGFVGPDRERDDARQLKIPGALFDEEEEDDEEDDAAAHDPGGEEEAQDRVPSLPSLPASKGPGGTRRTRTRGSRASSAATESTGEDEETPTATDAATATTTPKRPLRRSSRLSTAGASPEPSSSPQKSEKKPASSKRSGVRASTATDVTGGRSRAGRKRKSTTTGE